MKIIVIIKPQYGNNPLFYYQYRCTGNNCQLLKTEFKGVKSI